MHPAFSVATAESDPGEDTNSTAGYYSNVDALPSGHWSFAQNQKPTFITPNGLRFTYDDTKDLKEKETRSLALATDLDLVARTLKALRRQGTRIDWDRLSLVATGPKRDRAHQLRRCTRREVMIGAPLLAHSR